MSIAHYLKPHAPLHKHTMLTIVAHSISSAAVMNCNCRRVFGNWSPASIAVHSAGSMPAKTAARSIEQPVFSRALSTKLPNMRGQKPWKNPASSAS